MTLLRSALYVPGDRPERFSKAESSGADAVILDLEDAVSAEHKSVARENIIRWLSERPGSLPVQVRIGSGAAGHEDLAALSGLRMPFSIRVPKVESPRDLEPAASLGRPLIAILESARGVESAAEIARFSGLSALALGESDLASELGTRSDAVLDYARVRALYAARAAGLNAPMLSVFPGISDPEGLVADTERGRDLGLFGRAAIHPSQIPPIHAVFLPSARELAWARDVLSRADAGGVSVLDSGEMVDPAMLGRAREILARAEL